MRGVFRTQPGIYKEDFFAEIVTVNYSRKSVILYVDWVQNTPLMIGNEICTKNANCLF